MKRIWGRHLSRHDRLQAIILIRWCQRSAVEARWQLRRETMALFWKATGRYEIPSNEKIPAA